MSDPQRIQKIPFFVFMLLVCLCVLLFGMLGPDEQFSEKHPRSEMVFLGCFGFISSTVWFFFGMIDWSDWNTIKKQLTGKEANGDADTTEDDRR